jgi:hypothetical protein
LAPAAVSTAVGVGKGVIGAGDATKIGVEAGVGQPKRRVWAVVGRAGVTEGGGTVVSVGVARGPGGVLIGADVSVGVGSSVPMVAAGFGVMVGASVGCDHQGVGVGRFGRSVTLMAGVAVVVAVGRTWEGALVLVGVD